MRISHGGKTIAFGETTRCSQGRVMRSTKHFRIKAELEKKRGLGKKGIQWRKNPINAVNSTTFSQENISWNVCFSFSTARIQVFFVCARVHLWLIMRIYNSQKRLITESFCYNGKNNAQRVFSTRATLIQISALAGARDICCVATEDLVIYCA